MFEGHATFSINSRQRYFLRYRWRRGNKLLVFLMLNPSTADENGPDPTVRRCINFAKANDYDGVIVLNVYPLISTDPKGIKGELSRRAAHYNEQFIHKVSRKHRTVVVAWGGDCKTPAEQMRRKIKTYGFKMVLCLGTTKAGQPRHPLYLANKTELRPW